MGESWMDESTYIQKVTRWKAVCTCGWDQIHTSPEAAKADAENHWRSSHVPATTEEAPSDG